MKQLTTQSIKRHIAQHIIQKEGWDDSYIPTAKSIYITHEHETVCWIWDYCKDVYISCRVSTFLEIVRSVCSDLAHEAYDFAAKAYRNYGCEKCSVSDYELANTFITKSCKQMNIEY